MNGILSLTLLILVLSPSTIFLGAIGHDLNGFKEMMAEVNHNGDSVQVEADTVQTQLRLLAVYNDYFHNLLFVANLTDIDGNPIIGEAIVFSYRRKPAPITEPWVELGTATTNAAGIAELNLGFSGVTGSYSTRARHEQHLTFSASEDIVDIVFPSGQVIHIKSDGSIDPPSAPIQKNGDSYFLTSDITADSAGIAIERDNVTLNGAGHLIQPHPHIVGQYGISLAGRTNVTIENVRIRSFVFDIELSNSAGNTITKNSVIGSEYPTILFERLATVELGIHLRDSAHNSVSQNEVTNSYTGILLESSSNNKIYHNSFIDTYKPVDTYNSVNTWDDGYPSGGNFWSNYVGGDLFSGPYQNITGSDGIWDNPYVIDANNRDNYPLVEPWSLKPQNPADAVNELLETIKTYNLPKGTENSLSSKLEDTVHLLDIGSENGAIHKLMAFMSQVEALRGKKLTNEQADYLISEAQRIIDLIYE